MKKFNLKTLLIMLLVIVLCFALVACGDDGDNNDDDGPADVNPISKINAQTYFNKLWELSNNVGGEQIDATSDKFAVSADLSLSLRKMTGNKINDSVDIGIALKAVVDQANDNADTAVQLKLYDPSTDENWATVAFFLSDANYVYVEFGGQQFKVGFDTGYNDTWASFINTMLNEKVLIKKADDTPMGTDGTIADLLATIMTGTGSNWSLDTLANVILSYIGVDLSSVLDPTSSIGSIVNGIIPGIVDEEGNLNLQSVFTSTLMGTLAKSATKTVATSQTDYSLALDLSGLSSIASMIPGDFAEILDVLLSTKMTLDFTEKGDDIDGFAITAVFDSLKNSAGQKPAVKISINDLKFTKVGTQTSASVFGLTAADYSDSFNLNTAVTLDIKGVSVNPSTFNPTSTALQALDGAVLDGKYTLSVEGNLDLKNPVETNETKAYAYLAKDGEKIVEISLSGASKELGIKINKDAKITCDQGEVSIVDTVFAVAGKPFYDWLTTLVDKAVLDPIILQMVNEEDLQNAVYLTLKSDFVGVVKQNIDIVDGFKVAIAAVGDMIAQATGTSSATTSADSEEAYPISPINVFEIIKLAIGYVSGSNGLGIQANGMVDQAVKFITSNGNDVSASELYARIFAYNEDWLALFIEYGVIEPGTTLATLTKEDCQTMWNYAVNGAEGYEGSNYVGFEEMLTTLLPSIANSFVTIEGEDDVITAIGDGNVSALISMDEEDGLTITASLVINSQASIDVSITLDVDEYSATDFGALMITVPSDPTGWVVVA